MARLELSIAPIAVLVLLLLVLGLPLRDSFGAPKSADDEEPNFAVTGVGVSPATSVASNGHTADDFVLRRIQTQENNVELVATLSLPGNSHSVVVSGSYAYVSTRDESLQVVSISDPAHPRRVGGADDAPNSSWDLDVVEPYAYVADGWHGLYVINVSVPSRPRAVASVDTDNAIGIAVAGSYAYITDGGSGLRIIDVSVPTRPRLVGSRDTPGWAWGVAVTGNYAYVADGPTGLRIMDISNPASPREVSAYDTPGNTIDIVVIGGYAYVADGGAGLRIVDVSNPTAPYEVGFYDTPGSAEGVTVVGRYAYVSSWDAGLRIIDVADRSNPREVGYYDTAGLADDAAVSGEYIYVADRGGDLVVLRFTPGEQLPDLTIRAIEVTQGIQCLNNPNCFGQSHRGWCFTEDCDNAVPLVADKPTWVRVYPDCGVGCGWVNSVAARLYIRRGGEETVLESGPITVYHPEAPSLLRPLRERTFNFMLPPDLWSAGFVELQAEINPEGPNRVIESRTDNNFYPVPPIVFELQPRRELTIAYLPIHYEPPLYSGPTDPTERIQDAHTWAQKVYPLAKINYIGPWENLITVRCSLSGFGGEICKARLKVGLNRIYEQTTPDRRPDQLFGWLPDGALAEIAGGDSDPRFAGGHGRVAFGEDHPDYGWWTFAHEVAHNLGRKHTNTADCPQARDPGTDWPYENAHIQEYGFDVGRSFGAVVPSSHNDLMSYCPPFWISPYTYRQLFSALAPSSITVTSQPDVQEFFLVSGIVHADDSVEFLPVYRITSTDESAPPSGTQYCLELQDRSGHTLHSRCFDLAFFDFETGNPTTVDSFTILIPYHNDSARFVLKRGTTLIGEVRRSANIPAVQVLSPNGRESWSGTQTITWTASDADGDPLTYTVLYSCDGGQSWVPVAVDVTETSFDLDTTQIAGSTNALIRVLATDGVNTASDDSDAPFTVSTKPPQAFILAPEDGAIAPPGQLVVFLGQGYDLEDGSLGDEALTWASDRDGLLDTGAELALSDLSSGLHEITLTATDSNGNQGAATVSIFIGHRIYLPFAAKGYRGK
jgi:hypothetical protein